jgi:hypothetical protein
MTQKQIESLDQQEYSHFLSYGDPIGEPDRMDLYTDSDSLIEWISTLDSTTHPGMTFGYIDAPYMYTVL